jgi:hypothetical protein
MTSGAWRTKRPYDKQDPRNGLPGCRLLACRPTRPCYLPSRIDAFRILCASLGICYCHLEIDVHGHQALATCTHQLSCLHRHNTQTDVILRWVFMIVRLYPNYETRALVLHSTKRPADLLVLVRALYSVQPDMARHAIDVTACDSSGSSHLTDVRKFYRRPAPALRSVRRRSGFDLRPR